MNSDVRVADKGWLPKLVDGFRGSDAAIIGLIQTASRLREDGCGIPIKAADDEFDFVDGSVLAIRSDLGRRFGLFSPSFDYFYFEDVDLCLRYRQMGLQISLLDVSYEHERSSSSRLLPQFAVESVLNRNRARLFEKWGKYIRTRTLSNRIGVRFLQIDRQLQCASLPALFGLLTEHSTAVIDLWGVHPRLGKDLWCTLSRFYHADGTSMELKDCPTEIALKEGRAVRGQEAILERPDGTRIAIVASIVLSVPAMRSDGSSRAAS